MIFRGSVPRGMVSDDDDDDDDDDDGDGSDIVCWIGKMSG